MPGNDSVVNSPASAGMGRKAAYLIRPGIDGKIFKKHPSRYHTFLYLSSPDCDDVLAQVAPVAGVRDEPELALPPRKGVAVYAQAPGRLPSGIESVRAHIWTNRSHFSLQVTWISPPISFGDFTEKDR